MESSKFDRMKTLGTLVRTLLRILVHHDLRACVFLFCSFVLFFVERTEPHDRATRRNARNPLMQLPVTFLSITRSHTSNYNDQI